MKLNSRKLKKILLELIADMDKISDPGSFGVGVNIGNNGKYSVSISVDRFDPDEAVSDKYKCLILDDSVN